jgi:D-3-phosphoglycerate dehydrogenase
MIDAGALTLLRPGAILVNLGRGDLVDTDGLVDALRSGRLGAAALDVCDPEPIPAGHPLLSLPNVVLSPHIASASPGAARRLREAVAGAVARAVRGEPLVNVVNGVAHPRDRTDAGSLVP